MVNTKVKNVSNHGKCEFSQHIWVTYIPRSNEASRKNIEIEKDDDLMVFPVSKYDWLWLNNFSIARLKQAKINSS